MSLFFYKQPQYKIAMLGAGKVAGHLAPALESAGHQIVAIYSRRPRQAQRITRQLYEAKEVHNLDFSNSQAQVFILAVSDDAIQPVSAKLRLPPGSLLLHTSGGRSLKAIEDAKATHQGVLYPLQTFSEREAINFRQIPMLIEANNVTGLEQVKSLAGSLSDHVREVDFVQRQLLHAAGVFACNFTNHMLYLAEQMVEKESLPFELLKPLIRETLDKAMKSSPFEAQTGPAVRNDRQTMQAHLRLLNEKNSDLAAIYQMLTDSIQRHHHP